MQRGSGKGTAREALIARVSDAFDRAVSSPHGKGCGNNLPADIASCLVTCGASAEEFKGWSNEGLRVVVLAHALNAPAGELRAMAREATRQIAFVEMWNARGCVLAGGCKVVTRVQEFAVLAMELHAINPEQLSAFADEMRAKAGVL